MNILVIDEKRNQKSFKLNFNLKNKELNKNNSVNFFKSQFIQPKNNKQIKTNSIPI